MPTSGVWYAVHLISEIDFRKKQLEAVFESWSIPTNETAASATFQSSIPSSTYHLPSLRSISNVKPLQRALTALAARSTCSFSGPVLPVMCLLR
eukprot:943422-Prymnesium_polylepis.1